jgi:hypothetical protein
VFSEPDTTAIIAWLVCVFRNCVAVRKIDFTRSFTGTALMLVAAFLHVAIWHNPDLYGAGLEPMSALANSTFACGGGNQSSSILSMSQQGECRPWGSGVEEG